MMRRVFRSIRKLFSPPVILIYWKIYLSPPHTYFRGRWIDTNFLTFKPWRSGFDEDGGIVCWSINNLLLPPPHFLSYSSPRPFSILDLSLLACYYSQTFWAAPRAVSENTIQNTIHFVTVVSLLSVFFSHDFPSSQKGEPFSLCKLDYCFPPF